jgi:hypothetical protein
MSEIFFMHSYFLSDVITHTGNIAKHKKTVLVRKGCIIFVIHKLLLIYSYLEEYNM